MTFWEPIPWKLGFFASRRAKKGFTQRSQMSLIWRAAGDEWPPASACADDIDFARRTGDGFVAKTADERLFLLILDWGGWPDPPDWGLISQSKSDGEWHRWGSFSELPATWTLPESQNA